MDNAVKDRARPLWLLVVAACATTCAAPRINAPLPAFPPPADGVFQTPLSLVAGTEDILLPSVSMGQGRMAYAAKSNGNLDIYVRALAGGPAERLTTASTDDSDPAFSPEGRHIAWVAQAEDVKGDIWIMDADGDHKRRLTNRDTADAAPAWLPNGKGLYFTSRIPGSATRRIDHIDLASGARQVLVDPGWDPAPATDGNTLFYVRLDDTQQPRVFARRLTDGREVPLTQGGAIEAMPRAGAGQVVLARYVDDQTGDGIVNLDDVPSLWSIAFDATRFDGAPPAPLRPLTPGIGGELFASVGDNWLVYTAAGGMGLEIKALPLTGIVVPNASDAAILEAARAQDNPALRRVALRHLIATRPALVATAHYELARELAEREHYRDAIATLDAAIKAAPNTPLSALAQVEQLRLRTLVALEGTDACDEGVPCALLRDSAAAIHAQVAHEKAESAAAVRARLILAEFELKQGMHAGAVEVLESVARTPGALAEDRARALDLLGILYASWDDFDNVARVSEMTSRQVAGERFFARRAARRWVTAAQNRAGVPSMAALANLMQSQGDLPAVAARAAVALARTQSSAGHDDMALLTWESIIEHFAADRDNLRTALFAVAEARARTGDAVGALAAYEQLLRDFGDAPDVQVQARRGIAALGLRAAEQAERNGDEKGAYALYERLLQSSGDTLQAQRRYLALGAKLGMLPQLLERLKREASARPRDKGTQYALAYAYTLTCPPNLDAAEEIINRVLEIDPRYAAAHVTLSWIRMIRNAADPGKDWLEKAADSAEIARTLADPNTDAALWAAATVNKGNALFALGKLDGAFATFIDREVTRTPFESPLGEVLFHETFSRVALRVGELGVALDQATEGYHLSQHLEGTPREAQLTGLLACLNMLAERFEIALPWYERAIKRDEENRQWDHLVPMLRGKAMTQQALGQDVEALSTLDAMLAVLAHHDLSKELQVRGMARLLPRWIAVITIAADPSNMTAAEYGFDGAREEEIAHAFTARLLRRRGDVERARTHDKQRLAHIRHAYSDAGDDALARLGRVLMGALHESALLALDNNDADGAGERWAEALALAGELQAWDAVATITEAWVRLRTLDGQMRHARLESTAEDVIIAAQAESQGNGAPTARLARVHALSAWQKALAPLPVPQNTLAKAEGWRHALRSLDDRVQVRARARKAAEASGDVALLAALGGGNLPSYAAAPLQGAAGEGNVPNKTAPTMQGAPGDGNLPSNAASALQTPLGGGTAPIAVPAPPTDQWRPLFDRSLWDPAGHWLDDATIAYAKDPNNEAAPELGAFLGAATTRLLDQNDVTGAWRLLERSRLRSLIPPPERRPPEEMGRDWQQLRGLRGQASYGAKLAEAPALLAALEGEPLSLQRIRSALPPHGALVQVFAPTPDTWHWFVVDAQRLVHAATVPPQDNAWPAAAQALLGSTETPPATFLVDSGELPLPALDTNAFVSNVLSATYWVAAHEARSLARGGVLAAGGSIATQAAEDFIPTAEVTARRLGDMGDDRTLVHLAIPARVRAPRWEAADRTQMLFGDPASREQPLNLDSLAALPLNSAVALVTHVDTTPRTERALVQSLLMAGIPTTLVGPHEHSEVLRAKLSESDEARVADLFVAANPNKGAAVRFWGDLGMDLDERVDFAVQSAMGAMRVGGEAFKRAMNSHDDEDWRIAAHAFEEFVDTIDFLNEEGPHELLAASTSTSAKYLAGRLDAARLQISNLAADAYANLQDPSTAVVLRRAALDELFKANKGNNVAQVVDTQKKLGNDLETLKQYGEAAKIYDECVRLSASAKLTDTLVDCQQSLGKMRLKLYDYTGAEAAYHAALAAVATSPKGDAATPHRLLGILYESHLNNYSGAEAQFRAALAAASRPNDPDRALVASLLLDLARISRTRGDYTQALVWITQAETQTQAGDDASRANVLLEEAKVHWYRGNYRLAEERQQEALQLAEHIGNTRLAQHLDAHDAMYLELQAISLGGLIDLNQGKLSHAERTLRNALALARRLDNQSEEAAQLNNLGTVLREAGRLDASEEHFRKALAIDKTLNSREGRAFDLRNLALTLARQQRRDDARAAISEALELSRAIGNRYNELQCLIAEGDILETDGAPVEEVAASYQAAADLAQRLNVPEVEWRAHYALGTRHRQGGDKLAAHHAYESAMLAAGDLSRGRQDAGGVHRNGLYTDAMALALEDNDIEHAFAYAERARSADLWDTLASRGLSLPDPNAESEVGAVIAAREALRALRHSNDTTKEQKAAAEAALQKAEATLKRSHPTLAHAFVTPHTTLAQLQRHLPAGHTVLSYFVGPSATTLFVITATEARGVRLPVGEEDLAKSARVITHGMRAFAPVDAELAAMADVLLKSAKLTGSGVTIIPHGPLFRVPFAALPWGNGPLLAAMPVSYAVSGALLEAALTQAPAPRPRRFGAVAPPGTLHFAELEARAIAGDRAVVGKHATLKAFDAIDADALDVAAHGTLDSVDPLASGIALAEGETQGGRLELRSIFGLKHVPSIVTLSACETGTGSDGSEWLSLAHAFWSAGAHTVVASQARVSDLGAALMMKHFYRHVGTSRADAALQRAALTVREHLHHPGHWANFMLLGDFR